MENSKGNNNHHFDIHASIVFQLGESLISDSVQALVELIKNAYDADAEYANVSIQTSQKNDIENSRYPNAQGYICIKDNGTGMNDKMIERGWLTISNSLKREMKRENKKTKKGRTPLGDKGLGRMGAQRLGYNLEIFTKPEDEDVEYHVALSWRDFENKANLSETPIYFNEIKPTRKKGTTLLISDIKEPNYFRGKDAKENLEDKLSSMLSPYKEIEEFKINLKIDGKELNLASISETILRASEVRYEVEFNGENLDMKGKARLSLIRPQGKTDKGKFKQLVEENKGDEFYKFLSGKPQALKYNLKKSQQEGWFVEYHLNRPFKDFSELELIKNENGEEQKADPGKFKARIDSFDIGKEGLYPESIFDEYADYKEYIKKLSGIKVYRDGFEIRVDKDWLRLGKQWTSGRSYYGLRLDNTLGYISLTAAGNKNLIETTDREGFKETPHYNNFYEMLKQFIKFTGDVQSFLRRGWVEFYRERQKEPAKLDSETTPEEISERIRKSLAKADAYHTSTQDLKILLSDKNSEAQRTITHIAEQLSRDIDNFNELKPHIESLRKHIKEANKIIIRIDEYLKEISQLEPVETVLKNQIKILREQLEQIYELAGLGLTAEALSHEVHTIADRLADKTGKIRSYLKSQKKKDPKVLSFIEHVYTSISALRKQLSHLAPSLQYVREKKEKIDIFNFCRDIAYHYRDHLKNNNIDVHITPKNTKNFYVYINRGKLTQIFDNLFLNSDYWLREDIRTKNIRHGKINISIDKPYIKFYDNGRGVDPSVETTLFEPFVTAKGKGKGRGLGLFIVKQFLDSEGCSVSLLPERNNHNRLYLFEIDFTGGLDEG
jgi:signal transduction histidine kinase